MADVRRWTSNGWLSRTYYWLKDRFTYNEQGRGWRLTRWVLIAFVAALPVYYIVGMLMIHIVDDDPHFTPRTMPQGGSRAVAMAAALIEREVNDHGWVPNDTIFSPGYLCDNMQNFQRGMVNALGRFSTEMNDLLGRARGTSEADPDLANALRLNNPPDMWVWNPSRSLWPREPSETMFADAALSLRRYNERLAGGQATFERRADNFATTLERMASDLGSSSASLFNRAREDTGLAMFDWSSDDLFYQTKGRAYAYFMLLKELRADFSHVIEEKELANAYTLMLENFEAAVALSPVWVVNGDPSSFFVPNHLTTQGFYLLRARTQLREIVDILRA